MGALSALIVTTCVGPALVGALLVISQTGQIARGGAALFAMSIGMGTPLLVVGASAGKLLPKAGPWMDLVKKLFGVMMLAVAAWMLARIVPERLALLLWAVPAFILAWLLWSTMRQRSPVVLGLRALGVAVALYGVALAAGAALGGTDPLAPIPAFAAQDATSCRSGRSARSPSSTRPWRRPRSQGRSVLRGFLGRLVHVLQGDGALHLHRPRGAAGTLRTRCCCVPMSPQNNADDQALLKRFGIFGPPTIAFYGTRWPGARPLPGGGLHEGRGLRRAHPRRLQRDLVSAGGDLRTPRGAPPGHCSASLILAACAAGGFLRLSPQPRPGTAHSPVIRPAGRRRLRPRRPRPRRRPGPAAATAAARRIPEELPPISLPDRDGVPRTLADYRGKLLAGQFLGDLVRALPPRDTAAEEPCVANMPKMASKLSASPSIIAMPSRSTPSPRASTTRC